MISTPAVGKPVEPLSHHPTGEMWVSVAHSNPPITKLQVQMRQNQHTQETVQTPTLGTLCVLDIWRIPLPSTRVWSHLLFLSLLGCMSLLPLPPLPILAFSLLPLSLCTGLNPAVLSGWLGGGEDSIAVGEEWRTGAVCGLRLSLLSELHFKLRLALSGPTWPGPRAVSEWGLH